MKGILYILTAYLLGNIVSHLIGGFIPDTILGMLFLFCALQFKLIKADDVGKVASPILKDMMLLFVPVSVGIMVVAGSVGGDFFKIVIILLSTAALVTGVVGVLQQRLGRKK